MYSKFASCLTSVWYNLEGQEQQYGFEALPFFDNITDHVSSGQVILAVEHSTPVSMMMPGHFLGGTAILIGKLDIVFFCRATNALLLEQRYLVIRNQAFKTSTF